MDIQEIQERFENLMLANPDFDESLLEKDDEGCYEDFDTDAMYQMFEAGLEVGEKLQAAKAVHEKILENDCMIGQTWFMKGSPISALIKHAENIYKAEVVAQNSKIKFGTDDNERWWAHEVPFYGEVQMDRIEEHGFVEWDIHFNDCWQGPFNSKSECIKHLEECIAEQRAETQEQAQ